MIGQGAVSWLCTAPIIILGWTAFVQRHLRRWLGHKDKNMKTNQQLELGFRGAPARRNGKTTTARMARAQWWFARMREAVDSAMDWPGESAVRPDPMCLSSSPEN